MANHVCPWPPHVEVMDIEGTCQLGQWKYQAVDHWCAAAVSIGSRVWSLHNPIVFHVQLRLVGSFYVSHPDPFLVVLVNLHNGICLEA